MSLIGNPLVSTAYQTDTFSGDNSTVAYTLSLAPASHASIAVYISGLYQTPGSAYTITGTTITFTGAPPIGTNNIQVLHLGVRSSTLVPVPQSITPAMLNNANVIFWSMANTNVGIGNTAPGAPLTIGSASGTFTNPLFQAAGSANSWIQLNAQNLNNGNNASTDLVLARSDGTDTSGFIDIGINSNTYAQAGYSIMTPRSGYVFTNGGDLVLGTQTAHNILFHTGNTTSSSERMRIDTSGNIIATGTLTTSSRGIAKASMPSGSVLQVQSSTLSAAVTSTTTGWVDLGLSVVITPSSNTSKVMITAVVGGSGQTGTTNVQLRLVRDSTAIGVGDAAGSDTQCTGYLNQGLSGDLINFCTMNYMDSPSSTSAITYKVQFRNNNSTGTVYFNRANGTGTVGYPRSISTITVQEIAQ